MHIDWLRSTTILTLGALVTSACFDPSSTADTDTMDATDGSGSGTVGSTGAPHDDENDGASMTASSGPIDSSGTPTSTTDPGDPSGDVTTDPTTGPTTGDPDTDSSGTDTGPAPDACDPAEICAPDAPPGWSGPAAVYRGAAEPPPCPGALPTIGFTATDDLSAAAAACTCDCGDAQGFSCSATVHEANSSCLLACFDCDNFTLDDGQCTALPSADTHFSVAPAVLDTTGASCAPSATESIPEPSWNTQVQGCDVPDEAATCDGGRCTAAPSDPYAAMCIYTDGDAMCPEGSYTEREVVYTGLSDDRDCSACTCGAPQGSCNGTVYFQSGCGGLPILYGTVGSGSCGNVGQQHDFMSYGADPDVGCAPSGGDPTGGAEGTGAITVCCLP